jgi:hypothetical protein
VSESEHIFLSFLSKSNTAPAPLNGITDLTYELEYRCASITHILIYADSMSRELISRIAPFDGYVNHSLFYDLFHMWNFRAVNRMAALGSLILLLVTSSTEPSADNIAGSSNNTFLATMILLRPIPPHAVISTTAIENFLLNRRDSDNDSTNMSLGQRILHVSSTPLLLLGRNATIDMIYPAVTQSFFYSPEQLIGQPVSALFADSERETSMQQIRLIRTGQAERSRGGSQQEIQGSFVPNPPAQHRMQTRTGRERRLIHSTECINHVHRHTVVL